MSTDPTPSSDQSEWREAAADAVRDYLRADPERCMPTCRVGCPCDGGMQDAATGAPDGPQEIVAIVVEAIEREYTLIPKNAQEGERVPLAEA